MSFRFSKVLGWWSIPYQTNPSGHGKWVIMSLLAHTWLIQIASQNGEVRGTEKQD